MKKASWFHTSGAVCALMVLCLSATLSYGAVTADPAKATFTSPQQSATIKLTKDGAPIPAKDIRGWQFLASGHDYKHMLSVEKMDGALKIAPSKTLEVGSYDLNIETAQGSVIVQVFAPLSDLPDIVEKTAALTGLSEKKIEEKLGLTTPAGREEAKIDLPAVYYEGQTLELSMPVKPGRAYAWFMNGDLVTEGPGQNTLTYTFKEPGEYVLTYIETEKADGKTIAVARARAYTRVVTVPGVPTEVAANTETEYAPPPGYQKHVWCIDGQEVSAEPALKHTFKDPGVHTVECLASSPNEGPAQGFLRIRYNTTVNPK
jgi:plastocyanin